jgi:hypothetical protein
MGIYQNRPQNEVQKSSARKFSDKGKKGNFSYCQRYHTLVGYYQMLGGPGINSLTDPESLSQVIRPRGNSGVASMAGSLLLRTGLAVMGQ